MTIKQLSAILGLIGLVVGGSYALDKRYTPREVTKFHIADLQRNQMQIQRNIQIQSAQQWLFYWQTQVNRWTQQCIQYPYNESFKHQLNEAKRQRDIWQRETNRLMQQ